MKRSVIAALSVAGVVLVAVIIVLAVRVKRTSAEYGETRAAEDTVRSQFNAALESIAEIQDSLDAITPAETRVIHLSQNAENGQAVSQTQKEQMLGAIADLKQSIDNSNKRIGQLEKSLKKSKTEVAGLKRIIQNLKASVAEKEATIQRLSSRIDSLNVTVAGLQTEVHQGQETIAQQAGVIETKNREIGSIFYVIGTKKDLKDKGIVVEKGGVIGLGKAALVSGAFSSKDFTPLDTDSLREITIHGQEPQVLSAQPAASYEIQPYANGSKLVIKDPKEFRKVKYLVIMVKED